jgi:hypothetical protein
MRLRLALAAIGVVVLAPRVRAQRLASSWQSGVPVAFGHRSPWRLSRLSRANSALENLSRRRTRALEGAVLGGAALGFLGAVTGHGLCHFDDPCPHPAPFVIGGLVLGGAAGAAIGVRIGSALSRH